MTFFYFSSFTFNHAYSICYSRFSNFFALYSLVCRSQMATLQQLQCCIPYNCLCVCLFFVCYSTDSCSIQEASERKINISSSISHYETPVVDTINYVMTNIKEVPFVDDLIKANVRLKMIYFILYKEMKYMLLHNQLMFRLCILSITFNWIF